MLEIRKRKGLKVEPPSIADYYGTFLSMYSVVFWLISGTCRQALSDWPIWDGWAVGGPRGYQTASATTLGYVRAQHMSFLAVCRVAVEKPCYAQCRSFLSPNLASGASYNICLLVNDCSIGYTEPLSRLWASPASFAGLHERTCRCGPEWQRRTQCGQDAFAPCLFCLLLLH